MDGWGTGLLRVMTSTPLQGLGVPPEGRCAARSTCFLGRADTVALRRRARGAGKPSCEQWSAQVALAAGLARGASPRLAAGATHLQHLPAGPQGCALHVSCLFQSRVLLPGRTQSRPPTISCPPGICFLTGRAHKAVPSRRARAGLTGSRPSSRAEGAEGQPRIAGRLAGEDGRGAVGSWHQIARGIKSRWQAARAAGTRHRARKGAVYSDAWKQAPSSNGSTKG